MLNFPKNNQHSVLHYYFNLVLFVVESVWLIRGLYTKYSMRMRDELMGTRIHINPVGSKQTIKLTISLGKRRCSLSSIQPNRELCHGVHILRQTIEQWNHM